MSHSNGQNTDKKLISQLLCQKRNLENSFERKQRIWETTLKEHAELETIDAKLVSLGYYTGLNK